MSTTPSETLRQASSYIEAFHVYQLIIIALVSADRLHIAVGRSCKRYSRGTHVHFLSGSEVRGAEYLCG